MMKITEVYPNPRSKPNRAGTPEFCFTVSEGGTSRTLTFDTREAAEVARAEYLEGGDKDANDA